MANRSSLSVRIRATCEIVGATMWDMQGLTFEQAGIKLGKEKVNTLPELSTDVAVAADQISDWYEQDNGGGMGRMDHTVEKLCAAFEDLEVLGGRRN